MPCRLPLQAVLYGIFPAVLLGTALSWAYMKRRRAPVAKLLQHA
jgi:hypothetical protein